MEQIIKLIEKELLSRYSNIKVVDKKIYSDKKVEYVLMKDGLMGSLSVLANCTYDFLIITMKKEEIKYNTTQSCSSLDVLRELLEKDILLFNDMV